MEPKPICFVELQGNFGKEHEITDIKEEIDCEESNDEIKIQNDIFVDFEVKEESIFYNKEDSKDSCSIIDNVKFEYTKEDDEEISNTTNETEISCAESNSILNCKVCDFKCHDFSSFQKHLKYHAHKYQCNLCCYGTNIEEDMQIHFKCSHLKPNSFSCDYCNFKCCLKSDLDEHITKNCKRIDNVKFEYNTDEADVKILNSTNEIDIAWAERNSILKCKNCDFKCHDISLFQKHLKCHAHKYRCNLCFYGTNIEEDMETHFRYSHLKSKTFLCNYCDFKCCLKSDLVEHSVKNCKRNNHHINLSIKTVERPIKKVRTMYWDIFECKLCYFRSNLKRGFNNHITSFHKNDVRLRFLKKINHNMKTKVHSKYAGIFYGKQACVKSFRCKSCSFESDEISTVEEHYVNRHEEKLLRCEFCDYTSEFKILLSQHVESTH